LVFVARAVSPFDLIQQTPEELGLAEAAVTGETLLTLAGYYVGRLLNQALLSSSSI
jgi:hypothetical protein